MTTYIKHRYAEFAEQFAEDGVVCLRGALDRDELDRTLEMFHYTKGRPGPAARNFYAEQGVSFYQDGGNVRNWPAYIEFCKTSPLPDIVADLWGSRDVWFFYEQIFFKEGMKTRRTPWHQDQAYIPYEGSLSASVWINFEPVAKENSLEFVRGSHLGPIYNGTRYDPVDDTAGFLRDGILPRLPDIEGQRKDFDIVSWAVDPGDIIVFHHNILHGGAAIGPGQTRRTISLRFVGHDVHRVDRVMDIPPETLTANVDDEVVRAFTGMITQLEPGDPVYKSPEIVKVRSS